MIIVWSGWGILVPVFFVVGFLIGVPVSGLIPGGEALHGGAAAIISGLLTGAACFFLARKLEARQGRAFIDEATQQRIVVKPSAGSFFFIPTRYWAYIAPVLGIGMGIVMMNSPTPIV